MANFYFQTHGEAYAAATEFIAGLLNAGGQTQAGVGWGYTAAILPTLGYFALRYNAGANLDLYFVQDSTSDPNVPMRYLVMQPGFQQTLTVAMATQAYPLLSAYVATAFWRQMKDQCFQLAAGATISAVNGCNWQFSGQSDSALWNQFRLISTPVDVVFMCDTMHNTMFEASPAGTPIPMGPTLIAPPSVVSGGGGTVVNVAQPLDLDVAINQGQAILSVLSRTTTMIP
jgi:hypothetical protein